MAFFADKAQLKAEIEEKLLDLHAFQNAREIIRRRVLEVRDSPCKLTPLPQWSGTDAVLGSLDLSIHAIERTLDELTSLFVSHEEERPALTIVRGGAEDTP